MGAVGAAIGAYYTFLERGQFADSDAIVVITDSFADLARKWVGAVGAGEDLRVDRATGPQKLDSCMSSGMIETP